MDIDSSGASSWLYDYGFDISVAGPDFMAADTAGFTWVPHSHTFKAPSNMNLEMEYSLDSAVLENSPSKRNKRKLSTINRKAFEKIKAHNCSKQKLKSESCASGSKACREKLRRDKLNERFLELSSILKPGRLLKTDKVAILSDAVRAVTQLRNEAQKLKEMNDELLSKVKELKTEKNELRDEKNRLKADKEKLEQQIKLTNVQPSFLPQPSAAKGQAASHKLIPFTAYPGIAMWQFMLPAAVDTSKDHLLRPPVA